LGGDITIDTFDGKVKLNVLGTQNGTKVKLKGFPVYKKEGQFGIYTSPTK
jgi:curved DNA-binding protein